MITNRDPVLDKDNWKYRKSQKSLSSFNESNRRKGKLYHYPKLCKLKCLHVNKKCDECRNFDLYEEDLKILKCSCGNKLILRMELNRKLCRHCTAKMRGLSVGKVRTMEIL